MGMRQMTQVQLWAVMLGCIFVSCGSLNTPTPEQVQGVVTPTADLNGCFTPHLPIDKRLAADVVLTRANNGTQSQTAVAHVGQIVEVQLTAGVKWKLAQSDHGTLLQPNTPFGWFDGAQLQCIWDFTATAKGKADLEFSGGLVCESGKTCPTVAVTADFAVTIA
jgi:hypothetical protein